MLSEIFVQIQHPQEFAVAPEILYLSDYLRWQQEQAFIDTVLARHPTESVEDVSSVVHETNRIPDSRILLIRDGKILRLDGILVDNSIEKTSYLGRIEYSAFEKIKEWSNSASQGIEAWFSAPFPEGLPIEKKIYPVSKTDFGEIRYSSDGKHKILLKKAVLLDINSTALLEIANWFADIIGEKRFLSAEEMRSRPLFCTRSEMNTLLQRMSEVTDQTQMIDSGMDLKIKENTYYKLSIREQTIILRNPQISVNMYYALRRQAEEEKMIGNKSESCPAGKTAFQEFSNTTIEGIRLIRCHCPICNQEVTAMIAAGKITCLSCGASALYAC